MEPFENGKTRNNEVENYKINFPDEPAEDDCCFWSVAHYGTIKLSRCILKRSGAVWKLWDGHYEVSEASKELRIIMKIFIKDNYTIDYPDSKFDTYLEQYGKMTFSPLIYEKSNVVD